MKDIMLNNMISVVLSKDLELLQVKIAIQINSTLVYKGHEQKLCQLTRQNFNEDR